MQAFRLAQGADGRKNRGHEERIFHSLGTSMPGTQGPAGNRRANLTNTRISKGESNKGVPLSTWTESRTLAILILREAFRALVPRLFSRRRRARARSERDGPIVFGGIFSWGFGGFDDHLSTHLARAAKSADPASARWAATRDW